MSASSFLLSIEPTEGNAFVHGFHLGSDEAIARREAECRFHGRNAYGLFTRTIALLRDGKLFAVYDGEWV